MKSSKHVWQSVTKSWIWSYNPDQYTVCFALCRHLDKPRWPAWICMSRSYLWLVGPMILVLLSRRPSSIVISSWKFRNGWIPIGTSCIWLGQPAYTMWLSEHKSWSCSVASCSNLILLAMVCNLQVISLTLTIGGLILSCNGPSLDKQSASW